MTDEERKREGAEEEIEDLEAPASAQEDVAGGGMACHPAPSCGRPSVVCAPNQPGSCEVTQAVCDRNSHKIVIFFQ
ncbi:MAG TPA: hypothetical protein VN606_04210 [Thermoleophilaceae bacterium]|jgi:hypothetical protein|nr:hypothetical protein [Thermoleophilaceae bacterium]